MYFASRKTCDPSVSYRSDSRTGSPRRGVASVEFAWVCSVMFTLIFASIELCRACMVLELMTEAARRSCRVAIVEGTTSTQIKQAATDFLKVVGINGETVNISVNDAPVDSVDPQSMPVYTEMTVIVSTSASSVSWLPSPLFVKVSLSGRYTMRRE